MPIKKGDTVRAHYTGTLDDGTVFDSSRERDPLEFVLGKGMLIPGFEAAVEGREVGETVTVTIAPEDAYGETDPELLFTVPRAQVPDVVELLPVSPVPELYHACTELFYGGGAVHGLLLLVLYTL